MKKIQDIVVKVGSYEKNGETKNRYQNVGKVLQADDGGKMYLLNRTFNPAGLPNPDNRDSSPLYFFDVKEQTQSAPLNDEIPFALLLCAGAGIAAQFVYNSPLIA